MTVSFCFFFKQKTSYVVLISDWSSDVCSSDLGFLVQVQAHLRSWIVVREFHLATGRAVRNLDAEELRLKPRRQQRSCRSRRPNTDRADRSASACTAERDPAATFRRCRLGSDGPPAARQLPRHRRTPAARRGTG